MLNQDLILSDGNNPILISGNNSVLPAVSRLSQDAQQKQFQPPLTAATVPGGDKQSPRTSKDSTNQIQDVIKFGKKGRYSIDVQSDLDFHDDDAINNKGNFERVLNLSD